MKSRLIAGLSTFVVTTNLLAAPSPYSKFGAVPFKNTTRSTVIRDGDDPKQFWVLPPSTGAVTVKDFQASGNIGFCDGLKSLYKASNATAKRIGNISRDIQAALPDLEAANKKVTAAREKLGELRTNPSALKMLELTDQLDSVNARIADVATQLDQCQNACEELTAEYQSLREEAKKMRDELRQVRTENREIATEYDRAANRLKQAETNLAEVMAPYDALTNRLNQHVNDLMSMYANQAKLEGGIMSTDYDLGWDKAVKTLQDSNPEYAFTKIQTYNVKFNTNPISTLGDDTGAYYASLPMLLSYSIAGLPLQPTGAIKNELVSVPDSLPGDYRLSLIGACPRAVANFFEGVDVRPDIGQDGLPRYALSMEYSYPAAFKYKVTATYNMFKMYELIKKQSTSGGFFSTSSHKSVRESNVSSEAFNIDWKSSDPDEHLSAKERNDIAVEFRTILVDRVLQAMAKPVYSGSPAGPENAGVPPENGAVTLGAGIVRVCPLNIYCQVGGWILQGLGSIFGSSSSESRFKTTSDFTASETWSSDQVRLQPGIATFQR